VSRIRPFWTCYSHLPSVVSKRLLKSRWWSLVVGIILILASIVLVVHVLGVLLRGMFSTLAVDEVLALGLGKLIGFGSSKTGQHLFGKLVLDYLACVLSVNDMAR
jgi:hypothetical protein